MSALYLEYLKSDKWKTLSDSCKKLADYMCNRCESTEKLHAHHKTYDRVGDERMEDLECLCKSCHENEHGKSLGRAVVKRITTRVNSMDLLNVLAKVCKSSKDLSLMNILLDEANSEGRIIIINISTKATELGVARSKLNSILSTATKEHFLFKINKGVYMINPYIFIGRKVRSNEIRESLQIEWAKLTDNLKYLRE